MDISVPQVVAVVMHVTGVTRGRIPMKGKVRTFLEVMEVPKARLVTKTVADPVAQRRKTAESSQFPVNYRYGWS